MEWALDRSIKARDLPTSLPLPLPFHPSPPPPSLPPPPPSPSAVNNFADKISPNILFIIAVLAVILFIAGLVHLLVRCLLSPRRWQPDHVVDSATTLQGQLQQLFNLHDAGVDQCFIDTLPVFLYKAIVGLQDPFDCAVCLCEFEAEDKLRLLPSCSHAFHVQCIDTWLMSHSTCPLCRASLLSDFSPANSRSPIVLGLESASQSSRDPVRGDDDRRASINDAPQKPAEVAAKEEATTATVPEAINVVPVKLGKFRRVHMNEGDQGGSNMNSSGDRLDQRRCFSMGTYEYFMDEDSSLRVAIKPPKKKATAKTKPGHRFTISECGECHWKFPEGLKGFDARTSQVFRVDHGGSTISATSSGLQKKESFSVSRTWLRAKNNKPNTVVEDYSQRALSFRLPFYPHVMSSSDESKLKSAVMEPEIGESEKRGCKVDVDVEVGRTCNLNSAVSRADETPSFARRTLLWIAGRKNRITSEMDQI